ncbi:hypothetical protein RHGRI_020953 [Rhododendron griersonianum]|uniref:Uncharacterized protein n=1 Tax=Rhododendron griersonianum TaxID=479676 RepID=A0AAV6JI73_9ERIC|nr:hypothetical protein RHGRI_020953 [Rhododendron griersonianum]
MVTTATMLILILCFYRNPREKIVIVRKDLHNKTAPTPRNDVSSPLLLQELEGEAVVDSGKGANGQERMLIGQNVTSPGPTLGQGKIPQVHYRSTKVVHTGEVNDHIHEREVPSNQFSEMIAAFKKLAVTQKVMLKHMEEWSPIKIGSQASLSKGEVKERVSTSKDRSRLGKEPVGAGEMPKSWYEPVRRPYVDEETSVMGQG